MNGKKKWILIFICDTFCSQAKLAKPQTLEEAYEIGKKDPACVAMGGYMEFKGVLGVDITKAELREMGYEFV